MNYYCHFCEQVCTGNVFPEEDSNTVPNPWWDCDLCSVSYRVSYYGALQRLLLDTEYRHEKYSLQLWYDTNETRIIMMPKNPEDTIVEVAMFPFLVAGVTPQNINNKLSTLINFS